MSGPCPTIAAVDFELSADQLALQGAAEELLLAGRSPPSGARAWSTPAGAGTATCGTTSSSRAGPGSLVARGRRGRRPGRGWRPRSLLEVVGRHVGRRADPATAGGGRRAGRTGERPDLAGRARRRGRRWRRSPIGRWSATGDGDGVPDCVVSGAPSPWRSPRARTCCWPWPNRTTPTAPACSWQSRGQRPPGREAAMDLTREFGRYRPRRAGPPRWSGGPAAVERPPGPGRDRVLPPRCSGCAGRCAGHGCRHARDREQFGRPIGSFQAVKHRCADMLVDVEGMRSATWWAAWCLATDDPQRSAAASTAKVWCSDAADRVLTSALQVHGGIGFTWESRPPPLPQASRVRPPGLRHRLRTTATGLAVPSCGTRVARRRAGDLSRAPSLPRASGPAPASGGRGSRHMSQRRGPVPPARSWVPITSKPWRR